MHHIATHSSSIDKNVFNSGYYEKRANLFTKLAFSNPNFLTNNFDLTGECELNEKKSQFNDGLDPYGYLHEEEVEAANIKPLLTSKNAIFTGGREVKSLNGNWRFAIGPMREGLR